MLNPCAILLPTCLVILMAGCESSQKHVVITVSDDYSGFFVFEHDPNGPKIENAVVDKEVVVVSNIGIFGDWHKLSLKSFETGTVIPAHCVHGHRCLYSVTASSKGHLLFLVGSYEQYNWYIKEYSYQSSPFDLSNPSKINLAWRELKK